METTYEKNYLRGYLHQLQVNFKNAGNRYNNNLSRIKVILDNSNLVNTLPVIKFLIILEKDYNTVSTKFLEYFEDIDSIIESFDFEIGLTLNSKFMTDIENYTNQLRSTEQELENLFKSNIQILNNDHLLTIDNIFKEFNRKTKALYSACIKSFKEIIKALKLNLSQYQISISKEFRSIIEKETETINQKLIHERQSLISGFKNDLKFLKEDFNLEKQNIVQSISTSTIEISNLKKGLEQLRENNFKLTQEIDDYSNKINNLIGSKASELNEELNKEIALLKEDYNKKIKEINDSYETAKKSYQNFSALAERAGIYGLTQNYAKKAKEEKLEYQNYRRYTTFSILAAIGTTVTVILIPIIEHWGLPINMDSNYYYTLMARLTISIMFFVLALYLSKQASKHYECYQENHRTYLQLAALEPFINRMSDEEQLNIRKSLIPIYFNQHKEGKFSSKEDEVKLPQITSHLKNLRQLGKINKNTQP